MSTTAGTVDIVGLAKELATLNYKVGSRIPIAQDSNLMGLFSAHTKASDVARLYVDSKGVKDVQALLQGYYLYLCALEYPNFLSLAIGSDVFPCKVGKAKDYDAYDTLEQLETAVSKDQYRPSMTSIYKDVDQGSNTNHFVATDGFRMYLMPDTLPLSESRDKGYYQFIGDTLTDRSLDEKYPPFKNVIPSLDLCDSIGQFTASELVALQAKVKCYIDICKVIDKYDSWSELVTYFDDLIGQCEDLRRNSESIKGYEIGLTYVSIRSICYNPKYLLCALNYLVRYVSSTKSERIAWYVDKNNPKTRATLFFGNDTLPAVLLMPVKASNCVIADVETGVFETM